MSSTGASSLWLAWLALGLLNTGVWLAGASAALLLGHLCEIAAAVAFALHAWPRVKPMSR